MLFDSLYDTECVACLPFCFADQLMTSERAKSEQLPKLVEAPDIQPNEHETKVKLRLVLPTKPTVYNTCFLCWLYFACVMQVHEWIEFDVLLNTWYPSFYSSRQHLSYDACKRGDYQNCYVLYCVLKLCTVINTLRWAVPTVLWIGVLSHWAHFTVLAFAFVYFVFIFYTTQWGGPVGIEA